MDYGLDACYIPPCFTRLLFGGENSSIDCDAICRRAGEQRERVATPTMLFKYLKCKWEQWKADKERRRKEEEEAAARFIWRTYYESKTMDDVSRMSGIGFEQFLARLFSRMGYTEIRLTPANDQGGDLLCLCPIGTPIVVQAKRWQGKVGNDAVQELLGAMRHYGRNKGIVVTNSTFTQAAIQLAGTTGDITLRDKGWLREQITEFFPPEIPDFSREEFDRIVKELVNSTRTASTDCNRVGQIRRPRGPEDYTLVGMLMRAGAAKGRELTLDELTKIVQLSMQLAEAQKNLEAAQNKMPSKLRGN